MSDIIKMENAGYSKLEKINNEILIYNNDENIKVEVLYFGGNVWLNTEKIQKYLMLKELLSLNT